MYDPKPYGLNELREMFLKFFESKDLLRLKRPFHLDKHPWLAVRRQEELQKNGSPSYSDAALSGRPNCLECCQSGPNPFCIRCILFSFTSLAEHLTFPFLN